MAQSFLTNDVYDKQGCNNALKYCDFTMQSHVHCGDDATQKIDILLLETPVQEKKQPQSTTLSSTSPGTGLVLLVNYVVT